MNDLKFALRQLLKNPGFTAVAVLTLALGIGANTAIFSVVNGVLLKSLPYPQSDRLVTLWERSPERGIEQERVSGPNYLDWRAQNSVFSEMAVSPGWDSSDFKLVLRDQTVKVPGMHASASLFTMLGGAPLLGRTFFSQEDRREGNRVALLGYGLWQRYFGGDPKVLGQSLTVDRYGRHDYTIVGVMPADYGSPRECELWLPIGWMGVPLDDHRSAHWHNVFARLKPGVTLAQAQAQMNSIQARLKRAYPGETIGSQVSIVPLVQQAVGRSFHRALFVLWGVVTGVLLIACANVANLMLARATSRQKEIAMRLALGAGRWRVMRQLLTESLLLAVLGGTVGVALSYWGLKSFVAASPANIPRLSGVSIDSTALIFTFGAALLTGALFGLAPAWHSSRSDLNEVLKDSSYAVSTGVSSQFTRGALVITEVALAIVLLVGAGLMLQSFTKLLATDRGFRAEQLVTAALDFSVSGFDGWFHPTAARPQVYLAELLDHVRRLPGVESAGAAYRLLRQDNHPPNQSFAVFGRPVPPDAERPSVEANAITPDYLRAFGTPLLRGRDFTEADTLEAAGVVLVNESFVRRFFANEDPIGKYVTLVTSPGPLGSRDANGVPFWYEIVGVVSDVKSLGIPPEAVPEIYHSYWQYPMEGPTLIVRARGDAVGLASAIQRETKSVIPNLPTPAIRLMTERVSQSMAQPRFQSGLLSLFGALALFLAACGIYGVLAYSVAQRRREIGIRMALGARKTAILSLVFRQGLKLVAAGVAIGLAAASALTRIIQNLLYGVTPTDPMTFAAVSLLLVVVAVLACWLPARRAAKVDPMIALRAE
jgi:putative ABC transport system permease protein